MSNTHDHDLPADDKKEETPITSWPRRKAKVQRAAMGAALTASALGSVACFAPAPKGRVVRFGGKTRTADCRRGFGWTDGVRPSLEGLSLHERTVAGSGWQLSGQLEHAAVAAFSELSTLLMMVGAPADLVERSHVAALDEIRHARRCFALAGAYFGEPLAPAPFSELASRPAPDADREQLLLRLAMGSLRDGAVGEGVAALTATHAAETAEDPVIAQTLATIAREEAEHAELGWDTVRWCLQESPRVAAALAEALERLEVPAAVPPVEGISEERLMALGQLPQDLLGRIAEGVVEAARARGRGMLRASRAA